MEVIVTGQLKEVLFLDSGSQRPSNKMDFQEEDEEDVIDTRMQVQAHKEIFLASKRYVQITGCKCNYQNATNFEIIKT